MAQAAEQTTATPQTSTQETPQAGAPTDEVAAALAAIEAAGEPTTDAKAPTETAAAKTEQDEQPKGPAAKGWAAVQRAEKKLLAQRKEIEAQSQKINAMMAEIEAKQKAIQEKEAVLDNDPVGYLTKKGLDFDTIAKRYLGDGKATPEEIARRNAVAAEQAIKAHEARLAQLETDIRQREELRAVHSYREDIRSTLGADEFELLRAWPGAEEEVFAYADKYAARTGEVLTPKQAAERLQAEVKNQLTAMSSHQAVKALFAGQSNGTLQAKQAVNGQGKVPGTGAGPKTLTNNLAATPSAGDLDWTSLSDEEQIQAALRLVQDGMS